MARPSASRIMPGTPYSLRAGPWNDLVDSHQVVQSHFEQTTSPVLEFNTLDNAVLIKNTGDPRKFGEYTISNSVITEPSLALGSFRVNPAMIDTNPDFDVNFANHWGHCVIFAADANTNEVGLAYFTGTAIARLKKRYAYHDHCDMDPAEGNVLVSHPSGSWEILWDDCTPNPTSPTEGWAILRHRGIWDRTMAGIADSSIPPGGEGPVEIHSGLASPPGATGEIVTALYRTVDGPIINAGDTVTVEWQSDYQVWTVYKTGGPAGTATNSPGSQYYVNETTAAGQGKFTLSSRPDDYESPGGEIQLTTGDITVDRNGLYWISYNLWVTPGSNGINYNDPEWDANGFIHKYITINCRSMNTDPAAVKVNISQRLELVYYRDEQVDPSDPSKLWKAREVCISGSGFFQLDTAWTCEVRWDSETDGHQITGDVHVHRVREGY